MDEHANLDFMAAVGELAVSAASLEHALHRAIVAAFKDSRVERFLVDMRASALLDHFAALYENAPGIEDLVRDIRESVRERNRLMHSELVLSFGGGTSPWALFNRKRGKTERLPTGAEIRAVATKCSKASMTVERMAETRDFDYDSEKMEDALIEQATRGNESEQTDGDR